MKVITIFIILIFIIQFWRCDSALNTDEKIKINSIDTIETLIRNNWNILINDLYAFNNQPLYFSNNTAYFFDRELGKVSIDRDTIFITGFLNMTLIGLITTITKDTLKIKKIEGTGEPFAFNQNYVFYNDKLIYNSDFKLNKIAYATSLRYGRCPEMAIEIESNIIFINFMEGNSQNLKEILLALLIRIFLKS